MHNDGKTYLWLPSFLTTSRLTTQAATTINNVHAAINQATGMTLKANYVAGEVHEYYLTLNDLDMGGAPFTRDAIPGMACCGPIENLAYIGLDDISLIVAFGGDIEGLPVWFELSTDPASTDCPFSTATPKEKWSTWGTFGESHKPVKLGTKWYRSNAVGESGELLLASQWVGLRSTGALVVKTKAEFQAIQAANQQPI